MSGAPQEVPGLALLAERVASLPGVIRAAARLDLPLLPNVGAVRRCWTTGVGSSAAHARFLACALEAGGLPARFVPIGRFASGPLPRPSDALCVLFSQGWSPTVRVALAEPERFAAAVLVTAVSEAESPPEKVAAVGALADRGVAVVRIPGAEEYGTLLRVVGPMAGYVAALRLARHFAPDEPSLEVDFDGAADTVAAAPARLGRDLPDLPPELFDDPLAFLAHGAYAECVDNLGGKVLEGMLRPRPPVWEPLEIAHGPLQQAWAGRAAFLALTRGRDPLEEEALRRLERCIDPARHRLVRLGATDSGLTAIFEHEALLDAAVLRYLRERRVDQVDWPGRGADRPLYELSPAPFAAADEPVATAVREAGAAVLAELTWPELAAAVARGRSLAVLPLGSTEQHGPHLPFDTDTRIAAALAARVCARLPGAVALPALPLGCAREHLDFPGTLSLEEATLEALLVDVARSVGRAGFAELFVFSAHGGNQELLARVAPALAAAGRPARVIVHASGVASAALYEVARTRGVSAAEAGHHAGEVETSMLLALAPASVRRDRLQPGRLEVPAQTAELFYPSLRPNAPDGTVGDPRRADAAAGRAYLDAWADALVSAYRTAQAGAAS